MGRDGFFFFQAEDGIRDDLVTGVQTCALPISPRRGGGDGAVRAGVDFALSLSRLELRPGWNAQGDAGIRRCEELRAQKQWAHPGEGGDVGAICLRESGCGCSPARNVSRWVGQADSPARIK